MIIIPTTKTAVDNIKRRAKAITKAEHIPHTAALERAAREADYEHWHHVNVSLAGAAPSATEAPRILPAMSYQEQNLAYMAYLARKGNVPVIRKPCNGENFHDVEIEGCRIFAYVGVMGPKIVMRSRAFRGRDLGWVELGVSLIHWTNGGYAKANDPYAWHVCKYGRSETRIDLSELSLAGVHALAHEFGLAVHFDPNAPKAAMPTEGLSVPSRSNRLFYLSPAFQGLVAWARAHPRIMKRHEPNSTYLGRWVEAATSGEPAPW